MKRVALLLVVVAMGATGSVLRQHLDAGDLTLAGVRALVDGLGWRAPAVFFLVVTFRQFLLLPSILLLSAGGLCFGPLLGAALGASGLLVSASLKFQLARGLGRDWFRGRMGDRGRRLEDRVSRLGPLAIGLSTAHPFGMLAPLHWAAGLSSLPFRGFVSAIAIGAPIRALVLASFGSSLAEGPTGPVLLVGGVAGLVLLLPLASPRLRRLVLRPGGGSTTPPPAAALDA